MSLSLSEVLTHPQLLTCTFVLPTNDKATLRPLQPDDVDKLAILLVGISPETRRFKFFPSYDLATAKALCEGIARLDKLLLVVELTPSQEIIGLFKFSFDISDDDMQRFRQYGIHLDAKMDCRIGLVLAEASQNQGIGSQVFPLLIDVAKKFGRKRMILWGGVFSDNPRAIRFYEKHGFQRVGTSVDYDGRHFLDMILDL